jgi:2-iminobutanoate/2-iminopropanoate deaminase
LNALYFPLSGLAHARGDAPRRRYRERDRFNVIPYDMAQDARSVELIQPASMYRALTYDHAARVGNLLFVAGQVGRRADGELVGPFDPVAQARQAFENLKTILEAAGTDFAHVAKVTTYYVDSSEVAAITEIRREYFGEHRPPHTGLVITMLGSPEVRFEVEVVAVIPERG